MKTILMATLLLFGLLAAPPVLMMFDGGQAFAVDVPNYVAGADDLQKETEAKGKKFTDYLILLILVVSVFGIGWGFLTLNHDAEAGKRKMFYGAIALVGAALLYTLANFIIT